MNRRLFMKSVGMATVSVTALLSSCTPNPIARAGSPYPHCPCPDCQAGRPTKDLHWVNLPPKVVILNNEPITVRVTNG